MITLNIISPELKNEIKLKNTYKIVQNSFILIGVFAMFYAIALISSRLVLESYLDDFNSKNVTVNKATENIIQRVGEINKDLITVNAIQAEEVNWFGLIAKISSSTSDDIEYSRIVMSKVNGLSLSGQSKTRDGLIIIKKFLDESPFLSDVNFPISNLLEKENIKFTITAKIKKYEFK